MNVGPRTQGANRPQWFSRALGVGLFALAVAALAGGCARKADGPEEQAVRAVFATYKAALGAGDGATAAATLSPKTLTTYGELLDLARHADRVALTERPLLHRLLALASRAVWSPSELAGFDGGTLFAAMVGSRFGIGDVRQVDLGDLEVSGDGAVAVMLLDGSTTSARLRFARVDGRWTLELSALLELVDGAIAKLPEQLGQTPEEWLADAVSEIAGRRVEGDALWTPPEPVAPGGAPDPGQAP